MKRMSILFGQQRLPKAVFATFELEEFFDKPAAEIEVLAGQESWASFEIKEVGPEGDIEAISVWDALSMPYETRMRIARLYHGDEEQEKNLMAEAEEETAKVQKFSPWLNPVTVSDAFFCSRVFTYALDLALSLKLSLYDSLEVVCHCYGIPAERLYALNNLLDNGKPCSFVLMDEDTRMTALLLYFLHVDGLLKPNGETEPVEQAG